jgi:hypothetical protein
MARILRRRIARHTPSAMSRRDTASEINQWLKLGLNAAQIGEKLIPESTGKITENQAIADLYAQTRKGPAQMEWERQLREGTQLPESPLTPQLSQPAVRTQQPSPPAPPIPSDQGEFIKDQIFQGQYVRDEETFAPVETRTTQERIDAKARRLYELSRDPGRTGYDFNILEKEPSFTPEEVEQFVEDGRTFTLEEQDQSVQDRIDERAGEVLTRPDRFRLQASPRVGTLARPSDEDVENLANELYQASFTDGRSGMSFKTAWEQAYQELSAGAETAEEMEFEEAQAIAKRELDVIDRMHADWGAGWTDETPQPPARDFATYGPVSLKRRTWEEAQAEARAQVEEEDRQAELEQSEMEGRLQAAAAARREESRPAATAGAQTQVTPPQPVPETKQQVISTLQGLYAAMRQAETFEEGAALLGQLDDLVKPEGILESIGYGMGKKRDQAYKTALKYLKRYSPENEKGYAKILAKRRAENRKRQDQIDKEGRGEVRQVNKEARQLAADIAKEERQLKKFEKENKIRVEGTKTAIRLRARLRPGRRGRQPMQDKLAFDAFKLVTRAGMEEAAWKGEKGKREKKRAALGPNADPDVIEAQETAIAEAEVRLERATAKRKAAEKRGNELLGRTPVAPNASTPPKPPTSGGPVRPPATEFF